MKREKPACTAAQVAAILTAHGGSAPSARTLQRHFAREGLNTHPDAAARVLGGSKRRRATSGGPATRCTGVIGGRNTPVITAHIPARMSPPRREGIIRVVMNREYAHVTTSTRQHRQLVVAGNHIITMSLASGMGPPCCR